ncbi:hypothetical protein, partial [Cupriavidus sp. amp6]|uniref:hypothetical protein n=1 Tax=Cupriavidus sp. amp6 TaxID=388051 RepID=UPI001E2E0D94
EHCITCEATLSEDSGVRYPAPTLIGCLFVKELRSPALPFSALRCLQQRNEIMQSFLRFVNRFSNLFLLQPARQLRRANPPGRPRNPCCVCLCSAALCCEGANIRPVSPTLQHLCHSAQLGDCVIMS